LEVKSWYNAYTMRTWEIYLTPIEELENELLPILEDPRDRREFFKQYPDGPWWALRDTPGILEKLMELGEDLPEKWREALLEEVV